MSLDGKRKLWNAGKCSKTSVNSLTSSKLSKTMNLHTLQTHLDINRIQIRNTHNISSQTSSSRRNGRTRTRTIPNKREATHPVATGKEETLALLVDAANQSRRIAFTEVKPILGMVNTTLKLIRQLQKTLLFLLNTRSVLSHLS